MVKVTQEEILDELSNLENNQCGQLVGEQELSGAVALNGKILNILHLNIRSVSRNFDNLLVLIECFKLSYCDVIVLSECFRISSGSQFCIPGFDTFYNGADYNRNDGVMILVRSSLTVVNMFHTKLPTCQATVSRICLIIGGITFGITAVYRPPPIAIRDFVEDLHSFLGANISHQIEIFTGDVNINILNRCDNYVNEYLCAMAQLGYVPYINSPTRLESGSCLDHMFVCQKLGSVDCGMGAYILNTHITDHAPIMLNIKLNDLGNIPKNSSIILNRVKFDLEGFIQLLELQDWSNILNSQDPDEATRTFVDVYQSLLARSRVVYTVKFRQQQKRKKWITNGIINSIKYRDKLKKKLLKKYDTDLESKYKAYRNFLNKLIRTQKNNYYRDEINKSRGDMKKIFSIVKDATNEVSRNSDTKIRITDVNHGSFASDVDMANYFNEYFTNVGVRMNDQIPIPKHKCDYGGGSAGTMFLKPLTENELIGHIASLKNGSSPGHDNISVNVIKQTHRQILVPLLHIFNLILVKGVIPSHFKISVVVPIHKSGSKTEVQNYRPISLISNFTKLFEKCLRHRLVEFFDVNKVLSKNQFGFTRGLSTADAMYKLVSEITNKLNLGRKCIAVFLDLAKAFDTVPHDRLLKVLSHYGVRGVVLDLFKSYLDDRYQIVKINKSLSERRKIKIGIPQGTVLGPVLFIAYINSLLGMDIGGLTVSYADDTALVFDGGNWEEVKSKVVTGFGRVREWLETYRLTLNMGKTGYIAFSITDAGRPDFNHIVIGNEKILEVHQIKYLGIVIDQYLKWAPHINHLSNRIRALIHRFYILRNFVTRKLLIVLYKALVESLIRYGILVWGGLYETTLHNLNIVQKYIIKVMYKRKRMYPSDLLFSHDICNIRTIYITTVCTYWYDRDKEYLDHPHRTRSRANKHLKIPQNYRNFNLKFIDYIAPKAYNLLPRELREITSKRKFAEESKKFVYLNYSKFVGILGKHY